MEKNIMLVIAAAAVVAVVAAVAVISISSSASHSGQATSIMASQAWNPTAGNTSSNSNAVKLSDTQYWQYSYFISTANLNQSAQDAMAGFNWHRQVLANGSISITLSSQSTNSAYTIGQAQRLYYIDSSLGDDSPPNGEYNLGDDGVVLTDSNGYIIRG